MNRFILIALGFFLIVAIGNATSPERNVAPDPFAFAHFGPCSTASLSGTYAFTGDGFTIGGGTAAERTPFAYSGHETYDGHGNLTGVITESDNGEISRSTYTGTYEINADCTGSAETNDGVHFDIFVVPGGQEFSFVCTDPGFTSAGWERRRPIVNVPRFSF